MCQRSLASNAIRLGLSCCSAALVVLALVRRGRAFGSRGGSRPSRIIRAHTRCVRIAWVLLEATVCIAHPPPFVDWEVSWPVRAHVSEWGWIMLPKLYLLFRAARWLCGSHRIRQGWVVSQEELRRHGLQLAALWALVCCGALTGYVRIVERRVRATPIAGFQDAAW